ncbi:MAG TPA: HlyD family efflux transporter periplasmic adaptor subunit [Chthoniobacteraceae bacterium]|nr:HlyD family efflux transporter periplasmic adaptor subunit [Chthoniobacteraceae bacterium]
MKRFFKILRSLFLLAAIGAAAWFLSLGKPAEETPLSGTVEVDQIRIASRYGGRITRLPFREGDLLKKGDLIAELEAPELHARRDLAEADLEELRRGPRPAEIAAAESDWRALEAQAGFAEADAQRALDLVKKNAMASSDAERATSHAAALKASAEAARHRYELLKEGTRPEKIAQAEARLREIDAQLRELRITAPAPTVLELLSVKPGDVVPPNRELATLLLPDSLWMRVYVPATWLPRLALGGGATLRVDGDDGPPFEGKIEQISRVAEFTPRNVQTAEERIQQVYAVKIAFENRSGRLRAGMSGEVAFPGMGNQADDAPKP